MPTVVISRVVTSRAIMRALRDHGFSSASAGRFANDYDISFSDPTRVPVQSLSVAESIADALRRGGAEVRVEW